ncbi:MAG: phosphoenolpyruvate synthase [Minisyncoccales bacterium]
MTNKSQKFILWFKEISKKDIPLVGGKNASLGEMYSKLGRQGVRVPNGFALTTQAYWHFLKANGLNQTLRQIFQNFNPQDIKSIQETGQQCRQAISRAVFPLDLKEEILNAYQRLAKIYGKNPDVAIRTSGVAEDSPTTSFAGQFETYLNIRGEKNLLEAIKKCIMSTFTDRAIAYRDKHKIDQLKFALSVGVMKMVRSDIGSAGIIFTLDTETGFPNIVVINSVFGLGEMIVKGRVTPDEFLVFKPTLEKGCPAIIRKDLGRKTKKYIYNKQGGVKEVDVPLKDQLKFSLTDEEILTLAKWAVIIEKHYNYPQDIEWAKDGQTGQLFIVQSRPETVHAAKKVKVYKEYQIKTKKTPILTGIAIGNKIGQGQVHIIEDISKISEFREGEVLVTKMTDPDWVPIMRIASAIITDEGGKTCHAAIIGRELGIPAIVGTEKGTKILQNGLEVTVDCTSGSEGRIFEGKLPFMVKTYDLKKIPKLKTKIMVNIGAPDIAFQTSFLPVDGVGLARIEFILAEKIRVHPLALCHYQKLKIQSKKDRKLREIIKQIDEITVEHKDKKEHFVKELAEGIAQIAAAFYPKPVIVRFSDFKTNEYRALIAGELFEPEEANPMLGWRGASRYHDPKYQPAFALECQAIKRCRDVFGLKNIAVMVPFCRTVAEGQQVVALIKKFGLRDLKIYVMCEIPVNVILANQFLNIFDGMSIGSNDLTQLVLGMDRDNAKIAYLGDERNQAVKEMIKQVIVFCRKRKKYCGICGQAPSDFPEFADFLARAGIESISLNPDTVMKTILLMSRKNK